MTDIIASAVLLIVLPLAFNAAFAGLALSFEYPDVLRRPTAEVLDRFRRGGTRLILLWWAFALTAVLLVPLAGILPSALVGADATLLSLGSIVGVVAGVVQFLGLIRWPFLVPYLARVSAEPDATPARKEAVDVVFQAFNRYLGVAVGEHLGLLFTGAWSILVGAAITQADLLPDWLGGVGIAAGAVLALCSLEFVGSFERTGWALVARLTPVAYVVWSLWLVATGVFLLL
ncbi:DUF4386 domain-containing protein [Cryobacterium sp. SO2]|uniref:DUF4386 domain-containing protein n=1 Tax=Cryobacterium sp. SO2 TaxID=1897060 RepID=UPI00223D64A7|nr:DUF4386 domain-containing protein [Cryobacterium sp. SO2]WEO77360.1 DUF4386 domain-containing protein [Cryobacterium sp. SO2]